MDLGTIVDIAALLIGAWLLLGAILGPLIGWVFRWVWLGIVWVIAFIHALIHLDLSDEEVSSVSTMSSDDFDENESTDADGRSVPALYEAVERLQLDVNRRNTIDILVLAGGDVPKIRSIIKAANDAIGIEVAEARERLGIEAPTRTIIARQHVDGHLEERELAL